MKLGFVGTGDITEAVITGISKTEFGHWPILISPRNREKAERLAAEYANVSIARDNQHVVDEAEMVFLAIRPQIAEDVVRALSFHEGQRVVSFVAATPLERLAGWMNIELPLSQAVPLPATADLKGATTIHPPEPDVARIFAALGTAIEVEDKRDYDAMAAASAIMGSYFGILDTATKWLVGEGVDPEKSRAYLGQLFIGLGNTLDHNRDKEFAALQEGHSTRGGLNEQVWRDFCEKGGDAALTQAISKVFDRITGAVNPGD